MIKEKSVRLTEALNKTLSLEGDKIDQAVSLFLRYLKPGKKILVCGNGGSAAQAQHFVAELVIRFKREGKGISAFSLTTDTSVITACANDYSYEDIFVKQVEALANEGDTLLCLSTSGNSPNVLKAAKKALEMKCNVISLTGIKENKLELLPHLVIKAQSSQTDTIQEIHIFLLHYFADKIEEVMKSGSK